MELYVGYDCLMQSNSSAINSQAGRHRLPALDALRGLIMILMALDHANGLIARAKLEPEMWALQFPFYRGEALAFVTRLVTHLAAPGFFFLMGSGMVFFLASRRRRGWPVWQIASHFLLRGALLVVLQFLVENPAWRLGGAGGGGVIYVGVLYALGGGMILGSLLLLLPPRWLLPASAGLILGIEVLLPESSPGFFVQPANRVLWLAPGYAEIGAQGIWVLYPILPWLGLLGLGMAYGHWLRADQSRALHATLWIGLVALAVFFPLRYLGGFGNIRPILGADWIAFLNLVKYPPSLTFLLFTMGLNLCLLGLLSRIQPSRGRLLEPLAVFGRVPLFFYLLHLYLYAILGQVISPAGMPIAAMYPFWVLGLIVLYPLCRYFGTLKRRSPAESWLRFV